MDEPVVMEESEPTGMEESPETEDETDKWYQYQAEIEFYVTYMGN